MSFDLTRTLPWKTKVICNWSPPIHAYNKMWMRSIINHNEVDQFFEDFASSIKSLVWESLNHTKKKAYNMQQTDKNSSTE
jgi:hypothetical protein